MIIIKRHKKERRRLPPLMCVLCFLAGFGSAFFVYTLSLSVLLDTTKTTNNINNNNNNNNIDGRTTAATTPLVRVNNNNNAAMSQANDEAKKQIHEASPRTRTAVSLSHQDHPQVHDNMPEHCYPWPGEDKTVEGGYLGYHLLLIIRQVMLDKAAAAAAATSPSSLFNCIWEYPQEDHTDTQQFTTYLLTHCQSVWIVLPQSQHSTSSSDLHQDLRMRRDNMHASSHNKDKHRLQIFESYSNDSDISSVIGQMQQQQIKHGTAEWLLVIPKGVHVILELLQVQLAREKIPQGDVTSLMLPCGYVTNLETGGQPVFRHPQPKCPGWVYHQTALQGIALQSSSLLSSPKHPSSLTDALLQALQQAANTPCFDRDMKPTTPKPNQLWNIDKEIPFAFIDTSHYTHVNHWRRLHATLQGTCDPYWNTPLGARDELGAWGHVHDPTWLRQSSSSGGGSNSPSHSPQVPPALNVSLAACHTKGPWYDKTRYALSKVEIATVPVPTQPNYKRVFCMVYTHSNRHDQLRALVETWAKHCDGFMAASNVTDKSLGAVDLWHEGPEIYHNMWLKIRSMWEYAHKHYLDQFDLFHIGGDDHFLIPENLRYMAEVGSIKGRWDHSKPLYLGGSLAVSNKKRYCGGGSGYTLNRAALDAIIKVAWNKPNCFPHWQGPEEDISMSRCFRQLPKPMECMDTNDEHEETRYHPWDAAYHGFWNHTQLANWNPKVLALQKIKSKDNMGQISKSSVSFHLKQLRPNPTLPPDSGIRFYYALLYGKC